MMSRKSGKKRIHIKPGAGGIKRSGRGVTTGEGGVGGCDATPPAPAIILNIEKFVKLIFPRLNELFKY
jgi:hypothetical protein